MNISAQAKVVLSIHYGHNATVGLAVDGQMVCLLSEERLNRIKNATGFPFAALKQVVQTYLDGQPQRVDLLVLADETLLGLKYLARHGLDPKRYLDYFCNTRKKDLNDLVAVESASWLRRLAWRAVGLMNRGAEPPSVDPRLSSSDPLEDVAKLTGVARQRIRLLNHHAAHAYSSLYFVDPAAEHLLFTIDGEGDYLCATVNRWSGGKLEVLSKTHRDYSLGQLYSDVTGYLGMRPNEHEFKVMGMAPYAEARQADRLAGIFRQLLDFDAENFVSPGNVQHQHLFLIRNLIYERFDNICGGLQNHTEDLLCRWISKWVKQTGIRSIVLSGGVAMNVKANKAIGELECVEAMQVVPSAGDESLPLGGCYYGSSVLGISPPPVTDLYLGGGLDAANLDAYVRSQQITARYDVERHDEQAMAERAGQLLAEDQIIARCVGREEWGARALGNRSILCNPSSVRNINVLNRTIKRRDFWMPFAPSMLAEAAGGYLMNPKGLTSDYMQTSFATTALAQGHIPAAIHPQDSTARPQTVARQWNPGYHAIIRAFQSHTGIGAVLNTSFNLHGEPNVSSPADAIHTVDHSDLKYLILGPYLLTKRVGV